MRVFSLPAVLDLRAEAVHHCPPSKEVGVNHWVRRILTNLLESGAILGRWCDTTEVLLCAQVLFPLNKLTVKLHAAISKPKCICVNRGLDCSIGLFSTFMFLRLLSDNSVFGILLCLLLLFLFEEFVALRFRQFGLLSLSGRRLTFGLLLGLAITTRSLLDVFSVDSVRNLRHGFRLAIRDKDTNGWLTVSCCLIDYVETTALKLEDFSLLQ